MAGGSEIVGLFGERCQRIRHDDASAAAPVRVSTVRGIPVEPLVDAMLGPPLVPPNWTDTPSPQEVADEARNDQIRAAYAEQDQVWQARSEVRSR